MRCELVVAHHREHLDWLNDAVNWEVRVYRKRDPPAPGELPNIGREAHTYLYHIVENYDSLADVTAFLQGDPRDHVPDLVRKLLAPPRLEFVEWGAKSLVDDPSRRMSHRGLRLADCYRELFQSDPPQRFAFRAGACFTVGAELIRRHARNFYNRALRWSVESPLGPWELERLWPLIFRRK